MRPFFDVMGLLPVFRRRKHPVPYVFFAAPLAKHAWPKSAACCSPKSPMTGISSLNGPDFGVRPYALGSLEGLISGKIFLGILKTLSMPSSQLKVLRSISMVRLAFVGSVTWLPPVKFQMIQVSIVPKSALPSRMAFATTGLLSINHLIFGPEKYVANGR